METIWTTLAAVAPVRASRMWISRCQLPKSVISLITSGGGLPSGEPSLERRVEAQPNGDVVPSSLEAAGRIRQSSTSAVGDR